MKVNGTEAGNLNYSNIILIGTGKIASECLGIILRHYKNVTCLEYGRSPLSVLKGICMAKEITYMLSEDRRELTDFFTAVTEKTLVISANNNYIFPSRVLDNANLKIINFHNALLPRHRGRNAVTWAIFGGDPVTGVTWHEVNPGIDTGNIIIQEEVPINIEDTALELVKKCMNTGAETFRRIIGSILAGKYPARRQEICSLEPVHYSHEIPNDGYLDYNWPAEKISCFLRSLDYGKFRIFPSAKMDINGRIYEITGYRLEKPFSKQDGVVSPGIRDSIHGRTGVGAFAGSAALVETALPGEPAAFAGTIVFTGKEISVSINYQRINERDFNCITVKNNH